MRTAARRDANEPTLFALARKIGWLIVPTDQPTDAIGYHSGRWWPIEIKSRTGTYTKAQQEFLKSCRINGARILTWRCEQDVIKDSEVQLVD